MSRTLLIEKKMQLPCLVPEKTEQRNRKFWKKCYKLQREDPENFKPKILKQLLQRENKEILKRQKDLTNPQRRAGILKEKHEQANGPETKPLIPRRESLLELNLIYISTPVPVHHLKASDDIWVCPWWKRGMPIWRSMPVRRLTVVGLRRAGSLRIGHGWRRGGGGVGLGVVSGEGSHRRWSRRQRCKGRGVIFDNCFGSVGDIMRKVKKKRCKWGLKDWIWFKDDKSRRRWQRKRVALSLDGAWSLPQMLLGTRKYGWWLWSSSTT